MADSSHNPWQRKEVIGDCTLYLGDMLDVVPLLNDIDAVVTDPPYGWNFMGKEWDHGVPGEHFWRVILDACKPGAHLLAFGGTRTHHRLMCAIEDAGWEIRDCLGWLYGQGFPKSLDVGKAIDKGAGAEREKVPIGEPVKRMIPGATQNEKGWIKDDGRIYQPGTEIPATEAAKQWDGWGTGLKPAWEPIVLARKPLEGTVAANILKYGTGGLNIDGCRISLDNEKQPTGSAKRIYASNQYTEDKVYGDNKVTPPQGRFPANLIHDGSDEVMAVFPETKSGKQAKGGHRRNTNKHRNSYAPFEGQRCEGDVTYGDSGSAARFFYCAKASRSERDEGNDHPTVKPIALAKYLCRLITPSGGIILDSFMGSGSIGLAAIEEGFQYIGIDDDEHSFNIACDRITNAVNSETQLDLYG